MTDHQENHLFSNYFTSAVAVAIGAGPLEVQLWPSDASGDRWLGTVGAAQTRDQPTFLAFHR